MVWFKVDDGLADHPKVLQAGNAAMGLWVRAGSWSSRHLTDGFIPDSVALLLGTRKQAAALVACGLWTNCDGGFQFHQWSEAGRQPTRETVENERKSAAERQRRSRLSRRDSPVTHDEGHAVSSAAPSRPVPTRPSGDVNASSSVLETAAPSDDDGGVSGATADVERVRVAVLANCARRVSDHQAFLVMGSILQKARVAPRDPMAYVLRSIELSPFEVQKLLDESEVA
jgi:hypothetical protein